MIQAANKSFSLQPAAMLGARTPVCCKWINMGGNIWRYVCSTQFCSGGGEAPVRIKETLLGQLELLSTSELQSMSLAQLQSYMHQLQTEIANMTAMMHDPQYSANAIEGFRQAILEFQAELSAVQDVINGTINSSEIPQQQQQNVNAYNNGASYLSNGSIWDSLSKPVVAGIPLWVLLAGGAGLLLMNK